MRRWLALTVMMSGCAFPRPLDVPDDATPVPDSPDAAICYGSFAPVCFATAPTAPVALTANTDIDTDASPMCDQHNDQMGHYCVVAGAGFTTTEKISAHGSKPLVLLSTTTLIIAGEIYVGSNRDGSQPRGAGATHRCARTSS